jgi:hypothetical protein
MGCRDMRCVMYRSGSSNMHYQTTAFVSVIVENHPVGNMVMPRITIYENDSYFQAKYSAKKINAMFCLITP